MGGGNPTTGAPVSTSSGPSDRLFGLECPIHPELSQTIRSALSSLKVGLEFCLAITVSANHIRDAPLETWLLKWIPHRSHPHSVMPTHQNVWAAFLRSLYTELRLLPCFGLFRSNKKRPEEALVFDLQISIKTFPASTSLSYFFSFCDQFPFRPISCLRGMFHLEVGYLSQHDVQQLFHRTPPAPPARTLQDGHQQAPHQQHPHLHHPHPHPTQSQPVHIHPTDLHKHQSASQIARSPVSISPPVATNTSFVGGSPSEYQLPPRSWEVHAPPSLIVPDNPFVPRPSDRDPKITSLFTTLNFAGREAPPAPVQLKLFEAPDIVPLSLSATPLRALPDEDDPFFDNSPELCFTTQAAHPEAEANHSETPLSFLHSCTVPALNFAPTELPSLAEIAQIFEPSLDLVTGGSGSEGFGARVS